MAPVTPPDYNPNPTPEEAAAGKKANKPILIIFGVVVALSLAYWGVSTYLATH